MSGKEGIGGVPPVQHQNQQAPPHWLLYFLVSDCDATAGKAQGSGARALLPPQSIPKVGRIAVLADPQGAVFALYQPEH